jgi:oligo-1,6-glucosidase
MLHTLRGTPFIYQGEEIGMTNISFESLDDFDDIETRGYIKDVQEKGELSEEEILEIANYRTRDNARTPMHWDGSKYAGFSEAEPWLKMNKNYPEINVKEDLASEDSVFEYYKQMIALRKKYPVFAYGKYDILLEEDQDIYAYQRLSEDNNLLVLLNFSENEVDYDLSSEVEVEKAELILNNYQNEADFKLQDSLRPYEARVYLY